MGYTRGVLLPFATNGRFLEMLCHGATLLTRASFVQRPNLLPHTYLFYSSAGNCIEEKLCPVKFELTVRQWP